MPRLARPLESSRFTWLLGAAAAFLTLAYVVGMKRILASWNPDLLDYTSWYTYILNHGRLHSLNGSFSSYSPPYVYLLAIGSNLQRFLDPVRVIKLLNVPFILASGALTFSICRSQGLSARYSLLAGWIIIVCPEIVANGLVWGQTDILETTFVLACVRLLIAQRPGWAMATLGVALSFKLQVIFLAPAILALLVTGELPTWSLFAAAAGYVAMFVPAFLAGRSPKALLGVYSSQTGAADRISMGAANPYCLVAAWTGNGRVDAQHPFFLRLEHIGVAVGLVLTACLIFFLVRQRFLLPQQKMIAALAVSALAVPFVLPKMHDRYFFIGDTLALVFGLMLPRAMIPAILLQVAGLMVYARYLMGFQAGTLYYIFPMLMIAAALFMLGRELLRSSSTSVPQDQGNYAERGGERK